MSPRDGPLLEVRSLRVAFPDREGPVFPVEGVDLALAPGETSGLVGESGSGKTLTALALLGLVPPPGRIEAGSSVCFRGEELVGASPGTLRRVRGGGIGMVFQDPAAALNPVLRVGEQIAEVLRVRLGSGRREARRRAVELLAEARVPDPERSADAYPHELSGGMRQRAVLAGALAGEPALLVADEPTSALDVTVQARILSLLDELRARRGMALLLISHDLTLVAERCRRVQVMYAGRIVEEGLTRSVFTDPAHPYTRGLLRATPRLGGGGGGILPVPGRVPAPGERPSGCPFEPRCGEAWDRCRGEAPPLLETERGGPGPEEGGAARCWLVEEGEVFS